jgi:RNA polymerase sigma factor (sigma-70 family)
MVMRAPPLPPFQTLLDEHGAVVLRLCRASLGAVDGDDCFQDTMLAALRAYPKLHHTGNLRGWLLTVAHNQVIDHIRRRSRRPVAPLGEDEAVDGGSATAAAAFARVTDGQGLWADVRRLPDKQRAAVVHRFVADLPYADIGVLLDCSEAAARQNVRAGLAALRRTHHEGVAS